MILKKIFNFSYNILRNLIGKPIYMNLNLVSTYNCSQKCSMCNASLKKNNDEITLSDFKKYLSKIKKNRFFSCTISGGEPTMVNDMPKILSEAKKHFPFGVSIITNLYNKNELIYKIIDSALSNNVNISVSFDGFGNTADKIRGVKNVAKNVMENIEYINKKKKELKSKSILTLHTVICNENLDQVEDIFKYSNEIGWNYSVAPLNTFYYLGEGQKVEPLKYSEKLDNIIKKLILSSNVKQNKKFLEGIIEYAKNNAPKLCPYLKPNLANYKIFLDPNGDVSLCNRKSVGNLNDKSLKQIFKSEKYLVSTKEYKSCEGCWMDCFIAPMLNVILNRKCSKIKFDLD